MQVKRVFLTVLDSVGIGAAPDAAAFGDEKADTLRRISASPFFSIPTLRALGLGNIDGLSYLGRVDAPKAAVARMQELSRGKDTTVGHFEIAGVISDAPLPTYPSGFPAEILLPFSALTGRDVLCNRPYSGTDVIRDYGDAHVATGDLIVYTSADSVFQIAAHEDVIPTETLYEYCRIARRLLTGKHSVGRVIARPFRGESGAYVRTENRRDFSIEAPRTTALDVIKAAGLDVIAVGKIADIFAGRGVTETIYTHNNGEGMAATSTLLSRDFHGLVFTNLVDFDMLYGHRQDVRGYAAALSRFDTWLSSFLASLRDGDVFILTADHGCDPGDESTDHTREDTPLLIYGKGIRPENLGTRQGFSDIGATVCDLLGVSHDEIDGKSMKAEIM